MQGSNSVDCVTAHNWQVSHSDFLFITFLNDRHPWDLFSIPWILLLELLNVKEVDQVDQLQMTGKQLLKQTHRPLFKSFGQDSMVSVGKGVINYLPCFIVGHFLFINQNSKQLNRSDCWMGIIQLDLMFLSELRPIILMLGLVPPDDVSNWSTAEEVLLLETQLFSFWSWIVWIEHTGDVFSLLSFLDSTKVISRVEWIEVELVAWTRPP